MVLGIESRWIACKVSTLPIILFCACSLKAGSNSPPPLRSLGHKLIAKCFRVLVSSADPKDQEPSLGHKAEYHRKKFIICEIFPNCRLLHWRLSFLARQHLHLFYPFWYCPLIIFVEEKLCELVQNRVGTYIAVYLLCLWKEKTQDL